MMVMKKYRHVYVAIPRTATHSVYAWLRKNYEGRQIGFYHGWRVPETYRDFTVFITVRNPYERVFSYWWLSCMMSLTDKPPAGCSFRDFMSLITQYKDGDFRNPALNVPEIHGTQKGYYDRAGASVFIRLEDFHNELRNKLNFVKRPFPKLPHKHIGKGKPKVSFQNYFGNDEEQLVWDYCAEDFEAFGYKRLRI